jgi:ribosomal protein S17E
MKKATSNNPILKFYCDAFGHNFEVSKKVTSHVKEYTCKCCKKQLTTNSNGHLTELTPTFKEINSILEKIYTTKMMRLKNQTEALTATMYPLKNIA